MMKEIKNTKRYINIKLRDPNIVKFKVVLKYQFSLKKQKD